jgi:hypothetical protein
MVLLTAAGLCLRLVVPVLAADPSPQLPLAFPKPQEIVAVDRAEWLGDKLDHDPYMLGSKDDEVSPGNYDYKDATGGLFHFYGRDVSGPYVNRTDVCPFILDNHLSYLGTGVWYADIPIVTAEECAAVAASPAAASPAESPPGQIRATTASVTGDVEYSQDGGKTFQPLTVGTVIEQGFQVSTGFEGAVRLNFGYGDLSVPQLTILRVDEYTSSNNLKKTQLFLQIGAVSVRVKHTDAIRGDFSVATETMANASIRDSEMIVTYAKETGLSTVYTVEDLAYVVGVSGAAEVQVPQGQKVVVAQDGTASTPAIYTAAELPSVAPFDPGSGANGGSGAGAGGSGGSTGGSGDTGGSSGGPLLAAAIAVIAVGALAGLLVLRARGRRPAGLSRT